MPSLATRRFDLVVTDLDNTLYDWEAFFVPSFRAMLAEVERISGLAADDLEASFRRVYQRHRTTEYAFAIEELDILRTLDVALSATEIRVKYAPAIDAFRSTRNQTLQLYPEVRSTLERLRTAGVRLVAHSDSVMGYVSRRLRQLEIDQFFDAVSAPIDHGRPSYGVEVQAPGEPDLARIPHIPFSPMLRKPDLASLAPLLDVFDVPRDRTLYVGDNLSRDVALASSAGIASVWARYGAEHDQDLRQQLLRITYWSEADVAAEARLRANAPTAQPTFVIDSFAKLSSIIGIGESPEPTGTGSMLGSRSE